jgi:anti-sigma B factor antagonist
MREAIHAAVSGGATKLIVDMKDVTTIDSSGVGELVGCYTTATNRGAKLKLLNLPPKISDVLTVTQLITVFDVFTNEKEAVASF